jgi:hypothetical protein
MGHTVRAIIATSDVADELRMRYPVLAQVAVRQGFVILPVDADFVDSVSEIRPETSSNEFALLTASFDTLLRRLSLHGPIAYIETVYFGRVGRQGAAVYARGEVLMAPESRESGPINRAVALIGVKRPLIGDRFQAIGLGRYRSNDDLIEAAEWRLRGD